MSDAAFITLLQALMVVFPPFGALMARVLPDDDDDPLVTKIREILPVESKSAAVRRRLEAQARDDGGGIEALDDDETK